eukprot:g9687.t1
MGILHEAFGDSEESRLSKEYQDQFFNDNLYSNFGDLGQNIRKYVEKYQNDTKNTARIESIEEMQRFVDEYPEFRRLSGPLSQNDVVLLQRYSK